jgi:HAD superfamily hydrolase (TIGR01509 family)
MTHAVAWDVDGTLVDSEALHHRALMDVSARYQVQVEANDERFIGVSMDQVWQLLRASYPVNLTEQEWDQAITRAYLARAPQLRAFPGALETLAELQRAGIRQCCVSNSPRAIVAANLEAIGAAQFFAFAITRNDVVHGKPDPEPYREACARLQSAPAEVLVVEDSATGIASARAAGCPVVHFGAEFAGYPEVLSTVLGCGA